jgi:azurin
VDFGASDEPLKDDELAKKGLVQFPTVIGEHASVTFPVARLRKGESYTYFCSYPSHALPMRGQLVLGD